MKPSVRLLLCGFLPALIGFGMSLLLHNYRASGQTWAALGLFGPLFWFFTGRKLHTGRIPLWQSTLLVHLPALVAWCLALYQILLRGSWFPSALGAVSQQFFLPFLTPAFALTAALPGNSLWPAFTAAFLMMPLCFYLGGLAKGKRYQMT